MHFDFSTCHSVKLLSFHRLVTAIWRIVSVWHSSITVLERCEIERVQNAAMHIILGNRYTTYPNALEWFNLDSLEDRRVQLCSKFVHKAAKHSKFKNWFKVNEARTRTRQEQPKYCQVKARLGRYQKSPLSYLTAILNYKK